MSAELGAFALALALALALTQTVLAAVGRWRRSPALAGAAEGAAVGTFAATALAFACLVNVFVQSDFSVANVAANSHTAKPLFYKVAASWGSHEGSMLLWLAVLTGFGAVLAIGGRGLTRNLKTSALGVQGALGALFFTYTVFASNPFARLNPAPVEGNSLNPVLQDPLLAIHPPFLYAGYVGLSAVFALACAALIESRADTAWSRWVRPWTLASWTFLTVGITLGSYWAYYELGWGGWWFWDPVENASFMPWLAATALLHSAIVTERRGSLAGWTVFLALAAFTFSMLGAFLVRSGVLTSVHAFALDPKRGVLLLIILGIAAGAGFALFAWRAPKLAPGGVFAAISRESALVLNNLFLSVAAATVLLGTLYPLIREALTGEPISVGPPYFNLTFTPLMVACLLILPAGPMLSWKRGDALGVLQRLWIAAAGALAVAGLVLFIQEPRKLGAALGVGLGAWLVFGVLAEIAERSRLGRASGGELWRRLRGLPRGSWGMSLAHLGLGVFVIGACVETAWKLEAAQALGQNGRMTVGAYTLSLDGMVGREASNYLANRSTVTVTRNGRVVCEAHPERRFYFANSQTTSEVAICRQGFDDIYLVLGDQRAGADGKPAFILRAFVNPLANLIFLGPFLMALGGLLSLSDRRLRLGAPRKA
ncbi:MAG: heme lyase CcmF/NrfE family subunit [Caulobacteraceae bacterium]